MTFKVELGTIDSEGKISSILHETKSEKENEPCHTAKVQLGDCSGPTSQSCVRRSWSHLLRRSIHHHLYISTGCGHWSARDSDKGNPNENDRRRTGYSAPTSVIYTTLRNDQRFNIEQSRSSHQMYQGFHSQKRTIPLCFQSLVGTPVSWLNFVSPHLNSVESDSPIKVFKVFKI